MGEHMEKSFLTLFWLSLISTACLILILVLFFVFSKKIIKKKNFKLIPLFVISAVLLLFTGDRLIRCCRDYSYFTDQSYQEAVGKVISFSYQNDNSDGNGEPLFSNPVFLIEETGEQMVFHVKGVKIGETYRIRYYPHTKICEVSPIS